MLPESWANTALRPRFFFLDIGAVVALPIVIFYPRLWTLCIVLVTLLLFLFLQWRGLLPMTLVKILRLRIGNLFRWPIYISRRRYIRRLLEQR